MQKKEENEREREREREYPHPSPRTHSPHTLSLVFPFFYAFFLPLPTSSLPNNLLSLSFLCSISCQQKKNPRSQRNSIAKKILSTISKTAACLWAHTPLSLPPPPPAKPLLLVVPSSPFSFPPPPHTKKKDRQVWKIYTSEKKNKRKKNRPTHQYKSKKKDTKEKKTTTTKKKQQKKYTAQDRASRLSIDFPRNNERPETIEVKQNKPLFLSFSLSTPPSLSPYPNEPTHPFFSTSLGSFTLTPPPPPLTHLFLLFSERRASFFCVVFFSIHIQHSYSPHNTTLSLPIPPTPFYCFFFDAFSCRSPSLLPSPPPHPTPPHCSPHPLFPPTPLPRLSPYLHPS